MGLAFVHDPHDPLFVTEQDSEVNQDRGVARVRICGPLHVTKAAVLSIVAAVVCTWNKGFAQLIWYEQSNASRPTVNKCRLYERPQIRLGRHVAHRIVNKDRIKGPAQTQSSNVALKVFALRIHRSIDCQHLGGHVYESHREVSFEMEGVVSAARPKVEHGARRRIG